MSELIERLEAAAAADANRTRGEWTQGELPRLIHHRPNADYVSACTRLDFAALAARLAALEHLRTIADDVNQWLIRSDLGGTGHQRSLAQALDAVPLQPEHPHV